MDEKGNPVLRKNGKPMYRASYSVLQDELYSHMTEHGFTGFERGERGSTAEHLTSLQYQIGQDKERLERLQERIKEEKIEYEPIHEIRKTVQEIEDMGKRAVTSKISMSQDDYKQLTKLAKEGVTSRKPIQDLARRT